MKIIGIESASMTASVAIVDEEVILAEYTVNHKKTHSQTLLPMLDEIVRMTEMELSEVDAIAVSGGPGSFTGLRIGSATAKGLGLALDKPLIHIPTLEAMAYNFAGSTKLICPMLDARRGQVFTAVYRVDEECPETVLEPAAMDLEELLRKLETMGKEVIFLGDGVNVLKVKEKTSLAFPFKIAPPHLSRERAAAVAALGLIYLKEGRTVSAAEEKPEYLRVSQAERVRAEKMKLSNVPLTSEF